MKPVGWGLAAGAAAGALVAYASRGPTLVHWPDRVRTAFPYALGGLVGTAAGVKVGAAASLARAASGHGPGTASSLLPASVATSAAAAVVAAGKVMSARVLGQLTETGRTLDEGFSSGPTSAEVTAGPGSLLSLPELGREGARYVGTVSSADDIRSVTGQDPLAAPVRVFVGVDAAATIEQRVGLAMAELRRTGAFERSVLLVQAPAGTGYANPTPVDVVEVLTRGDCAAVAVGYGLLPSFLSLGKTQIAARTQRLLLESIATELAGRAQRPRLLLYGESLGAKVQEAAVAAGPLDLDSLGIDAALWVGTPGGSGADEFHALCADESITIDRPALIPAALTAPALAAGSTTESASVRPRVWFLEHDGDPVVRFRPDLLLARPHWLPQDGSRGRNIPEEMTWKPLVTWAQVLVDTLFATDVKPGDFQSLGHDYRADLGGTVPAAFALPADAATLDRLEAHLRAKEIERAERIGE